MHPAGVSACITPLRADSVDGVNDLRIMKNGQKSSLNGNRQSGRGPSVLRGTYVLNTIVMIPREQGNQYSYEPE